MASEIPESCDMVVIGSGDHIFVDAARALRARGRRVELIAPPGCLSADLYVCVDECVMLRGA